MKLRCAECGAEADDAAEGWRAYLAGGLEGEEDPDPATHVFCPTCAVREFD